MRIYKHEPFAEDRNFGGECNHYLAMAPAGAWVAILDHDIFWGTGRYHELMCEAIAARPDAGAFAVVTNRCASPWQRSPGAPTSDDVREHRRHGELCRTTRRTLTDIGRCVGVDLSGGPSDLAKLKGKDLLCTVTEHEENDYNGKKSVFERVGKFRTDPEANNSTDSYDDDDVPF